MKKVALSLFVIFSFVFYVISERTKSSAVFGDMVSQGIDNSLQVPTSAGGFGMQGMGHGPMMNATMKDGQYTGDLVDAYYGNVQVQITVANGKITHVQFLDYPQDRRTSIYINSQAMPILRSETIQAQSASVNIVTGATATSKAFIESLQSAIVKSES